MKIRHQLVISSSLVILVVMGIVVFSIETVISNKYKHANEQNIIYAVRAYANNINNDMSRFKAISDTLSFMMEEYDYSNPSRKEVNSMLRNLMINNPGLLGVYTAYGSNEEGYSFDGKDSEYANTDCNDETGRFIPYWNRLRGSLVCDHLLNIESDDWYQVPVTTGKFKIFDPFVYDGVSMVSFIHPLKKDGRIVGVAGVDMSLNYIDELAEKVRIMEDDYAVVLSNKGVFMSHPTEKGWIGEKNIKDANFQGEEELEKMLKFIELGKGGRVRVKDKDTGEAMLIYFEPISTGNYAFALVVPEYSLLEDVNMLVNVVFLLTGGGLVVMILFVILLSIVLSNKIASLKDYVSKIGKGQWDSVINVHSKDEIGDLAGSIEDMAVELKESRKKLEEHSVDLEEKIQERTMELEEKNKDLEKFNKLMVNRELTMIDLKKKLKELGEK